MTENTNPANLNDLAIKVRELRTEYERLSDMSADSTMEANVVGRAWREALKELNTAVAQMTRTTG